MDEFTEELIGIELGGYRITHLIGEGGMAAVFAAHNILNPTIRRALKIIRPDYASQSRFVDRFSREARLLEQLRSDHIVTLHGLRSEGKYLYMELELLEGATLDQLSNHELERSRYYKKPHRGEITPLLVTRWLYQAAQGLADAHRLNIVHRDLKPANIFVCYDGTPTGKIKILDFGVAKVLDELDASQRHTLDGHVIGSPAFMAPEVCEGEVPSPHADVYGLALIGYQLLLGRHPLFDSQRQLNTMQVMLSHIHQDLPTLNVVQELPHGLDVTLKRAASRDPKQRYSSGADLAHELSAVLEVAELGVHPIFQPQPTLRDINVPDLEVESDPIYVDANSNRVQRGLIITAIIVIVNVIIWWGINRYDQFIDELISPAPQRVEIKRGSQATDSAQSSSQAAPKTATQPNGRSNDAPSSTSISPAQSSRSWLRELAFKWVALNDDQSRAIARHEVTVAQYQLCVKAGICSPASAPRISRQRYGECVLSATHLEAHAQRPMNCISYQDALEFTRWVDNLYREASSPSSILKAQRTPLVQLPTREDWLTAWGTRTYPWGDRPPTCDHVVYFESAPACGGPLAPTPVCTHRQGHSQRGVCDLAGNLWEWVLTTSSASVAQQRPVRPSAQIIGGGWSSSNYDLTRGKVRTRSPQTRAPHIGMRLVLNVSPSALP